MHQEQQNQQAAKCKLHIQTSSQVGFWYKFTIFYTIQEIYLTHGNISISKTEKATK